MHDGQAVVRQRKSIEALKKSRRFVGNSNDARFGRGDGMHGGKRQSSGRRGVPSVVT